MNDLQKLIISELIKRNESDFDLFYQDFLNTFQIKAICDILGINRNRYNYLVRTQKLEHTVFKFILIHFDDLYEVYWK
jgi:hypothetical protein